MVPALPQDDTSNQPASPRIRPTKVTLSLTAQDDAGHGLCHRNLRAAHTGLPPLGGLHPLGTRTKKQGLRVCAFQRPLSKTEAHQSAVPQPCPTLTADSGPVVPRTVLFLVLKLPPVQEGTHIRQRGSTKELREQRDTAATLSSYFAKASVCDKSGITEPGASAQ